MRTVIPTQRTILEWLRLLRKARERRTNRSTQRDLHNAAARLSAELERRITGYWITLPPAKTNEVKL